MNNLSLEDICKATSARTAKPLPGLFASSICTDSRKLKPGCLFVALRGEKFDGHDFVSQAAASGAVAALVDDMFNESANLPTIRVRDTRFALGEIARFVRRQFQGKVIAVAGSNGKTGTKHLIHSALQGHAKLRGTMSPKSFNNDIGVPLAIFATDANDHYVVLELGTNHHGEIARLTEIAEPDLVVITNCSAEHLEGLTDLAGVRCENASILKNLSKDGLLIVNGDDADLLSEVGKYQKPQLTFGFNTSNDLHATNIESSETGTIFLLNSADEFFVPLLGRHTAANALAAIAVARHLGLDNDSILAGLAKATAPEMRLQLQHVGGLTILNDAYNANPASMLAALQTLKDFPTAGRRVAVLGEMRELGEWTESSHRDVGLVAARSRLDALVCVGPAAKWIAESARSAGLAANCITCWNTADEAAQFLSRWIGNGDLMLLKASRAIGLEKVVSSLWSSAAEMKAAG